MPPPRDVLPVSFSGVSSGTLGGFIRRPVRVPPRALVIWLGYDKRHPTVSRTPDVMGGTAIFHGTRVSVQICWTTWKPGNRSKMFWRLPVGDQETSHHIYGRRPNMTKEQVKEVLDRVLTWPQERQEDAAQMLLALEARSGEFYHPDTTSGSLSKRVSRKQSGVRPYRRKRLPHCLNRTAHDASVHASCADRSPGNHGLYCQREPVRRGSGGTRDF